jgi:hypothetical protein
MKERKKESEKKGKAQEEERERDGIGGEILCAVPLPLIKFLL